MTIAVVVLWLFVINLGIAFGAGLYESRVVAPLWASAPPASLSTPESGLRFWAIVTTGPLTLLTLASLYFAWQAGGLLGTWWLAAACVALLERLDLRLFHPDHVAPAAQHVAGAAGRHPVRPLATPGLRSTGIGLRRLAAGDARADHRRIEGCTRR